MTTFLCEVTMTDGEQATFLQEAADRADCRRVLGLDTRIARIRSTLNIGRTCFKTVIAGFEIALVCFDGDCFTVGYGKQIERGLIYPAAAKALGESIMHALQCEGKLDNSPA